MNKTRAALFFGICQFLSACSSFTTSSEAPEVLEQRHQEGRGFQGRGFQGRGFQGTDTSITTVEEIHLDGALSGADFIGATVTQRDESGALFDSTITAKTARRWSDGKGVKSRIAPGSAVQIGSGSVADPARIV